jgi:hypothetical protein
MKKKAFKFVLTVAFALFSIAIVNAHYTCCLLSPGSNIGLCTVKNDVSHGFYCVSGGCLNNPSIWQFVKKCDCMGSASCNGGGGNQQ